MSAVEELAVGSDDDEAEHENRMGLSAAAVAAAARSTLRAPSLQTLLEDIPDSATAPHPSSSGGDSEGKSKCITLIFYHYLLLTNNFGYAILPVASDDMIK